MPDWKTIFLPAGFLLVAAGYLTGQIPTFQKTYGGSGTEVGYHVIEVAGGYLVAGSTGSFGSGGLDASLIRLDAEGNVLWQRTYGGANDDEFTLVTTANDGGFLALGSTRSQGQGGKDILLVKTDNNGQVVWSKTIGGSANDNAAIAGEIMKFPNGYLISGQQYSVDFSSGGAAYFIRLNNSGTAVWSRAYTTSNGNNLVSTYVEGNTIYVGGGATDDANGGACFMKLDAANGNIIQSKIFSGDYNETIYNIRPTQDGNLLLSDGTWSAANNQFHRQWVVKATKDGSVLWSKIYALPGANSRGLAIEMPDGGILLSPYTFPLSSLSNGNLIKTDATGAIQWAYRYGGAGGDYFYKAFPTSDGGIIAIGATQDANGNQDMFVVKTDGEGEIAGCCPQALDVTAQDYALPPYNIDINISAFPTPQGWNIPNLTSTPVSADWCTTPQPEIEHVVTLAANETYTIDGVPYTAPDTVEVSVPGPGGCDTLVTYILQLAINTISGIVNDYTPVLSFSGCDSSVLQVGSAAAFSSNDKVLIIQMKGATVNLTNTPAFGNIISPGNAGNYEFNRIKSISGDEITLLYKLTRSYNVDGKVQLIRVPEYDDATADGLTCKPWDGTTGGVLVLDVSNTLTLNGDLDVSEKGFRGGKVVYGNTSVYHLTDYFYPPWPDQAASKGEGVAEIPDNQSFGRGRSSIGGGGGNAHNGGGGGGGNAGSGGNGGWEYYNTPASPDPNTNGIGGLKTFENDLQKIVLGGGGGAGHANDYVGTNGGNGGGIIIVKTKAIQGNNHRLQANGGNVVTTGDNNNDGQGGGGAGGAILIETTQINGPLQCELKGGRGGDCLFYVTSQIIGAGGGGGGGKLCVSGNFPGIVANLSGGINGMANQNLSNGAMTGEAGKMIYGLVLPHDTVNFQSSQFALNIALTPPSCGDSASGRIEVLNQNIQAYSLNGGPFQNNPVFDNLLPGHYTVTALLSNGCINDTVAEVPGPSLLTGASISVEDESCRGLGRISIRPGTGTPPFEYRLNGGTWVTDSVFSDLSAGVYTLVIRDATGCSGTHVYTVQGYDALTIQLDSIADIDCIHKMGYIAVSAGGGSPPYSFHLNNGMSQSNGFFDQLTAGQFTAVVVDSDTCETHLEGLVISQSVDSTVTYASLSLCDKADLVFPNGQSISQAGVYRVALTGKNGCDSILVYTVDLLPNNLFIPNVFAPERYGENEKFTVFTNSDCIQSIQVMRIYDRWGELIFEQYDFPPNEIGQGWNGEYKGKKMPPGVYAYYVELELSTGLILLRSGDVTILR